VRRRIGSLMAPGFAWTSPEGSPASLPLFLLEAGDARRVAAQQDELRSGHRGRWRFRGRDAGGVPRTD
jgi:hypothetical protein